MWTAIAVGPSEVEGGRSRRRSTQRSCCRIALLIQLKYTADLFQPEAEHPHGLLRQAQARSCAHTIILDAETRIFEGFESKYASSIFPVSRKGLLECFDRQPGLFLIRQPQRPEEAISRTDQNTCTSQSCKDSTLQTGAVIAYCSISQLHTAPDAFIHHRAITNGRQLQSVGEKRK